MLSLVLSPAGDPSRRLVDDELEAIALLEEEQEQEEEEEEQEGM